MFSKDLELGGIANAYEAVAKASKESMEGLTSYEKKIVTSHLADILEILKGPHDKYKKAEAKKLAIEKACATEGHVGEWIKIEKYEMSWKNGQMYTKTKPVLVRTCTRCGAVEEKEFVPEDEPYDYEDQ